MHIVSVIIGIVIVYFLQSLLYDRYWNDKLDASAEFQKRKVTEGELVTVEEMVENGKWLPLPMVTMKYMLDNSFQEEGIVRKRGSDQYNRNEVFSVLMFQRIRRKVNYRCTKRGLYEIRDFNVQVGNLFLSDLHIWSLESENRLMVHPKCVNAEQFLDVFQNVYGNVITNYFTSEDPFIYRGVREYNTYDRMKTINWSATAKTGEMKVNVLEHTSQRNVVLFLNLQRDTMLLNSDVSEESIRLVKTFALEFLRKGIPCEIYTNGRDCETGEVVNVDREAFGKGYMEIVNDSLARIVVREGGNVHREREEDDFLSLQEERVRKAAKDNYVIFISNDQREDFQKLLLELKKQNRDFSWIVPVSNVKDYHVGNVFHKEAKIWRLNWEGARGGAGND